MAIKILNTKNYAANGIKILVYGAPGAGKTRLCATAPNPIVLSAESGLLSVRHEALDYIPISTIDDLYEAYDFCIGSEDMAGYDTICLDSVSEIAEQVLANERNASKDGRQAYGNLNERMNSLLRCFRDIPGKNVYFSAKMEFDKGADGVAMFRPSLPGKSLTQGIGYFFDEEFVLLTEKDKEGNVTRKLQTSGDSSYEAKDRSGSLFLYEAPDLGAIIQKIAGGIQNG